MNGWFTCNIPSRFPHSPEPSFPLALPCPNKTQQIAIQSCLCNKACEYFWLVARRRSTKQQRKSGDVSRNRCLPTVPASVQSPWRSAASVMNPSNLEATQGCFHGSQRGNAHQQLANTGQQRFYGKFNACLLNSISSCSVSEKYKSLSWLLLGGMSRRPEQASLNAILLKITSATTCTTMKLTS